MSELLVGKQNDVLDSSLFDLMDLIDDYRNLTLSLFEKLVQWKFRFECIPELLFNQKTLYKLNLFFWRNINCYKELIQLNENLVMISDSNFLTLFSGDNFFVKTYFKFPSGNIKMLTNGKEFLRRVLNIEKLFEKIDPDFMSFMTRNRISYKKTSSNQSGSDELCSDESKNDLHNRGIMTDDVFFIETSENYQLQFLQLTEKELKSFFYFHTLSLKQNHKELIDEHYSSFENTINNAYYPKFLAIRIENNIFKNEIHCENEGFNKMVGLFVYDIRDSVCIILHYSIRKYLDSIDIFYQLLSILWENLDITEIEFPIRKSKTDHYVHFSKNLKENGFFVKNLEYNKKSVVTFSLVKPYIYKAHLMSINLKIGEIDFKPKKSVLNLNFAFVASSKNSLFIKNIYDGVPVDLSVFNFLLFIKYNNFNTEFLKDCGITIWEQFEKNIHDDAEIFNTPFFKDNFVTYSKSKEFSKELEKNDKIHILNKKNSKVYDIDFKSTLGFINTKLECQHSYFVNIEGKKYLKISKGQKLFHLKGKKIDFNLYIIFTNVPNLCFYFIKCDDLSSLLRKYNKNLSILLHNFFNDFDFGSLKQSNKDIYVKSFHYKSLSCEQTDLLYAFSNMKNIDVKTIIFDIDFNFDGKPHDTGLVYKFGKKSEKFEEKFIIGLIHLEIEKELGHPLFSMYFESK